MKFGLMLPHYRQVASADSIRRVALEAERVGFHSVWASEHMVVPDRDVERFGNGYYDPLIVWGTWPPLPSGSYWAPARRYSIRYKGYLRVGSL